MGTTDVPIDEDIVALLQERGADPRRELETALVLELFRAGELSRGRAAELLGMDLLSFLRLVGGRRIPVVDL